MSIIIIAAMAPNRAIAKDNKFPWGHIDEEFDHFQSIIKGNVVIMGRKTFEHVLERRGGPIPTCVNMVLSRTLPERDDVIICRSLKEAIEKSQIYGKDVFIIGGAEVFKESMHIADKLYLSYIKKEYKGDRFFPHFDESKWKVTKRKDFKEFEFVVYERK